MAMRISIGKRNRKRYTALGEEYIVVRYSVDYTNPKTNVREQRFFQLRSEAVEYRNNIIADVANGTHMDPKASPTVGQLVDSWLEDRQSVVRDRTYAGYQRIAEAIKGPLLMGATPMQKTDFTLKGIMPPGAKFQDGLAKVKVSDLGTADIRRWHRTVSDSIGLYTANRTKTALRTVLDLGAEEFNFRPPAMPRNLQRSPPKARKEILNSEQVGQLLKWGREDQERGLHCIFAFLTGVRIGEQLGLLWEDVDFENSILHIKHTQEMDGSIIEKTKTEAGTRDIPINSLLRTMLLEWQIRCPRLAGKLYRVFPGPGRLQKWPLPRKGGGSALTYTNFRKRYWVPGLEAAGVPYVTPHSARHFFISTLQAKGFEVGLVAQLAGHADASVTLSHYTQAVRGGESAMEALTQ